MNKSQISKIIRFLFTEKEYGIKEVSDDEVWLLNAQAEFPIICVVVYPRKDQTYYEKKYREYQKLLGTNATLLIVNDEKITKKSYMFQENLNTTFINEVLLREYYQSSFPDYMLGMLQRQLKHTYGYISWISIFVGITTFIISMIALNYCNQEVSFLVGGYFRYAILNWNEPYRLITSIFSNNNIYVFIIYFIALYYYEYVFSIEHSHFRFGLILFFATLFSNIIFIYADIEIIANGLASSIMSLATVYLLKFTYVWTKFPEERKNIRLRYIALQYVLLFVISVNDMPSFLVGGVLGVFCFVYMRVKRNRVLMYNFIVLIGISICGVAMISSEVNTTTIDNKIYYKLKKNRFDIKYYDNKIERLELRL